MTRTSESPRKSLLILQSLWSKDKNCWIDEYPVETELYILSKVIKDLAEWHRNLLEMAHNSKITACTETTNYILDLAAEVYSDLQKAKERFRYLKSKHPTPIWMVQIKNKLQLLVHKLHCSLVNFHGSKNFSRT